MVGSVERYDGDLVESAFSIDMVAWLRGDSVPSCPTESPKTSIRIPEMVLVSVRQNICSIFGYF